MNQSAPPAVALKNDFVSFAPFPEDGPAILTIVAYNFIKDHVQTNKDGTTEVFDALEFFLGTNTNAGPRFIKTWPSKYSIHEKSNYSGLYRAATGKLPVSGSKPDDILGKGITADLLNEDKKSKKGTDYTRTSIKGIGPVMKQLIGEIVPQASLQAALKLAMAPKDKNAAGKPVAAPAGNSNGPDEDIPF